MLWNSNWKNIADSIQAFEAAVIISDFWLSLLGKFVTVEDNQKVQKSKMPFSMPFFKKKIEEVIHEKDYGYVHGVSGPGK